MVYLRDEQKEYDLVVRDCWAYDNEDYNAKNTGRLQLSDGNGCSRKKKLFGVWKKSAQTGNSGATLVLHNNLYAFKFPDKAQVFLKCDIEICRNGCDEPICEGTQLIEATKRPAATTRRITTTARPIEVTTTPLRRIPQTRAPVIRTRPPVILNQETSRRPEPPRPTPQRATEAPTRRPERLRTARPTQAPAITASTLGPLRCFEGSEDPRCQRTKGTAELEFTTEAIRTRPQRTRAPNTRAPIQTTEKQRIRTTLPPTSTVFSCDNVGSENDRRCRPDCFANPDDPRCPQSTTIIPTTRYDSSINTSEIFNNIKIL